MELTAAEFEALVSGASPEVVEDFVAALWDARGWKTHEDGETLVAREEDGAKQTLGVCRTVDDDGVDADILVWLGDGSPETTDGSRVVTVDELYQMTRYAVDSDVTERLLATHFDVQTAVPVDEGTAEETAHDSTDGDETAREREQHSTDSEETAQTSEPDATGTDESEPTDESDRLAQTVADTQRDTTDTDTGDDSLVLESESTAAAGTSRRTLLVAVGTGILAGLGLAEGARMVVGDQPPSDASTATPTPKRGVASVPIPGVTADGGVEEATALARSHVDELRETGYTLRTTRTIHDIDQRLRSSLSLEVTVDTDERYLATVATAGPGAPVLLGSPPSQATYWSDGDVYLRATSDGEETTYNSFRPPDGHASTRDYWVNTVPFGGQTGTARRYFAAIFEVIPTAITGASPIENTTLYRLRNTDERPLEQTSELEQMLGLRLVRDITLTAEVDERGIIRSFHSDHTGQTDDRTVRVRRAVSYTDIGETSVERPTWYDRALEE